MKHYTRILSILTLALLTIVMPATAQTADNKNKAIVVTTDGTQELNTDDISVIRFDGDKVTFVQPWGNTTFDRTLRSLTFLRPLPGTLRLTATTDIGDNNGGNRAQSIDGDGYLAATWADGDVVYVYADATSTTSIGTLTPQTYGASTATLTGDIDATSLENGQTLYFSTKERATFDLTSQDGTVESLFYFTATAPITIDGGNASVGNLAFARPIAVVKFTLMDKGNSDAAISATSLTVSDGTNIYNVTPSSATDVLYVGIADINGETVTLNASDGSNYYYYQKTGVSFTNNNYYAINVKMKSIPTGALPRMFTVSSTKQVFFSKGNLCANYDYSDTWSWVFAPHQWSCFGDDLHGGSVIIRDNGTVSIYGDTYVDLFGWSTDATNYGIRYSDNDADYSGAFIDWGNTIGNGWYTLSKEEWVYLLRIRDNANKKYGHGSVGDVKGLIILPETWTLPTGLTFTTGRSDWANSYSTTDWAKMEAAGAVFLPAAGRRERSDIVPGNRPYGYYWSSTPHENDDAYCISFTQNDLYQQEYCKRHYGLSVRLVHNVE